MLLTDELADAFHQATCESMRRAGAAAMRFHPAFTFAELTGGLAVYAGEGSPFTQVAAFGYRSPEAKLEEIANFYQGKTDMWELSVSPFTSPHLLLQLTDHGYRLDHFEVTMAQKIEVLPPEPNFEIEVADDPAKWIEVSAQAWGEEDGTISRFIASIPGQKLYVAYVDGQAAGIAALASFDEMDLCAGGAVLSEFRNQGLQRAMYDRRIRDTGVGRILTVTCVPGTTSYRNAQRSGFEAIYTRAVFMRSPT